MQAGDPCLRRRCREIDSADISSYRDLVGDMFETMRNAPGVGLAANQVGVDAQLFVMEDTQDLVSRTPTSLAFKQERIPFAPTAVFNPLVTLHSDDVSEFYEGCLSVPGYRALVKRWKTLQLSGLDPDGNPISLTLSGWAARIAQHEIDHLNGVLYVDKMEPMSFCTQEHWKRILESEWGAR